MKRPLALVGFTYLLTQAVSIFLGRQAAGILGAACLLAGLLLLLLRKKRTGQDCVLPAAAFTAAAACLLFCWMSFSYEQAVQQYAGRNVLVKGMVSEEPDYSSGKAFYTLTVTSCGGSRQTPLAGKELRLSANESFSAETFDDFRGTVHLYRSGGSGYFSNRNRLLAHKTVLQGYIQTGEPYTLNTGSPPVWKRVFYSARRYLLDSVAWNLPSPENALVSGILAGEKQAIPDAVEEAFRGAGVSHLLSVSGLHMAAAAQLLLLFLSLLPLSRRGRSVLAAAGVILFMGVTCFTPSVVRSGIMYLIMLCGRCFYRRADSLNSLGFAVLLLCLFSPFAAADCSLLLSFSATLGILLWTGPVQKFVRTYSKNKVQKKLLNYFLGTLMMSLAATLFTLPVSLLAFEELSLVSPLANLLVLTPSSLMIYTGLLAVLVGACPVLGGAAAVLWKLTEWLAHYLIASTAWCASLPFAQVPTGYRFVRLWLGAALLLFGAACLLCCRRKELPLRLTALLAAVLLFANGYIWQLTNYQKYKITIAASSEGVSAILTYGRHGAVVGFGAGSYAIERILRREQVRQLDMVVLLSQSNRESQQATAVISEWNPPQVVLPPGPVLDGLLEQTLAAIHCRCFSGSRSEASLWNSVLLTYADGVTQLRMGRLSILFCGDSANPAAAGFVGTQILVCSSLPKGAAQLPSNMTILCGAPNTYKAYAPAQRGLPVVLGGEEDLVLLPEQTGAVQFRRND
ncbi:MULTISPECIES: ComEC/Rec2 family competence protein [Caproicibacterium]|jgi:competence protein ComEC|uniref:DUF4131 domain-containing protein n=1 Tax=Caproicibacterium lactatifermentans TaxID=2666138 RepID=A0A859DRM9_9FIRM|nr:ComEC/Rec2 family competence protein [Caproicibacterium lactatifermentans]ARP49933.1 hypothetical protein B6259_02935 [Ruminococcaceae bacterium CPB6]MDD4807748.1 ComEC/Rec2 family competence protein [Oscillospiraceae bacterium]QKN24346.1 DUF4131 domain-containing protein [Caproicibacterium lactatifermentans]QKO30641.1 DUF4131 domain-containing protein [Caproicibacterium lactatifermentans]